jgi:hypothetical protein
MATVLEPTVWNAEELAQRFGPMSAGVMSRVGKASHVSTSAAAAGAANLNGRFADVALAKNSAATWADHPYRSDKISCWARSRFEAAAGSSSIV